MGNTERMLYKFSKPPQATITTRPKQPASQPASQSDRQLDRWIDGRRVRGTDGAKTPTDDAESEQKARKSSKTVQQA